jgi:hypothetical protein
VRSDSEFDSGRDGDAEDETDADAEKADDEGMDGEE